MNLHYIVLFASSIIAAMGQLLLKLGASSSITGMLTSGKLWVGLCCYGVSTLLWIYVLSKEPLSKAYPFTALTFVLVYFLSYTILNETISLMQIVGAFVVLIGFMILALAS